MVDSDPLFMYQDPSLCSISLSRQRKKEKVIRQTSRHKYEEMKTTGCGKSLCTATASLQNDRESTRRSQA